MPTTIKSSNIATDAVGSSEIAAGAVAASEIASTFDISSKTVTLPAASVTAHASDTDLTPVRNDIATLALHSAIADNKAAYNLSNSFIDQYEDDTGIDVETDVDRNANEYISSIAPGVANVTLTLTNGSGSGGIDTANKFGTHSMRFHNDSGSNDWIVSSELNGIARAPGTGDWTIDFWAYYVSTWHAADRFFSIGDSGDSTQPILTMGYNAATSMNFFHSVGTDSNSTYPTRANGWFHYALQHDDSDNKIYHWHDGVDKGNFAFTGQNITEATTTLMFGRRHNQSGEYLSGYLDEWRLSNTKRYTNSVDFTPPTAAYSVDSNTCLLFHFEDANPTTEAGSNVIVNATGNYTSATQTALASVSTMGIVVLYKENSGSTVLNTDLVAQISANGGTNYANATLVAGGTFSTGIKIAAVSGVAVTAGTTPKYKISFANQASGSKETQVHGVALLY